MGRARRKSSALAWIVAPIGAQVQMYAGCRSPDDRHAVPQISSCRSRTGAHHGVLVECGVDCKSMAADGRMLWSLGSDRAVALVDLQPGR